MPGFIIDTRTEGTDENGEPSIELYYSDDVPASLIQKTVVERIYTYDSKVYSVSEEVGKVQSRGVRAVPTTIALDDSYEIERWEVPTHADDIREVLDAW
jgi:hypothetical protein